MKTPLGIILIAVLCSDCDPALNGNDSSALGHSNATSEPQETTPRPRAEKRTTTASEIYRLKCHVCMGSFQCYSPQLCDPSEKFCMIAEVVQETRSNVIKYCSEYCPFMDKYHGRSMEDSYIACCDEDLCNYKKLGTGSRLCASVPVVTMAFVASFLGTLRIGLFYVGM